MRLRAIFLIVLVVPWNAPNTCWLPAKEAAMCNKCAELQRKIEHCRRLGSSTVDQETISRIEALIEELLAQKAALHRNDKQER
jgi:uncharacterized protein YjaZ